MVSVLVHGRVGFGVGGFERGFRSRVSYKSGFGEEIAEEKRRERKRRVVLVESSIEDERGRERKARDGKREMEWNVGGMGCEYINGKEGKWEKAVFVFNSWVLLDW